MPQAWTEPECEENEIERTWLCRGPSVCDWLVVSLVNAGDYDHVLTDWLEPLLRTVVLPTASPKQWIDTANMLDWYKHELDETAPLLERFRCQEAYAYRGLAAVIENGGRPQLCRVYTLLLRRGPCAWKVSLGLASECPPGIPESMITNSDHVRAAAVFAGLGFSDDVVAIGR